MLEIFVLVSMCRYLHKNATKKGFAGWPFAVLMVFSWFVGGFGAGFAGLVYFKDAGNGDFPIAAIAGYILGVALACVGNALLVAVLPTRQRPDDDYDDDRPRRRMYDDDDDNYDSRRRYDDDRDDRDSRRRRYDEDDDDRDDRRRR